MNRLGIAVLLAIVAMGASAGKAGQAVPTFVEGKGIAAVASDAGLTEDARAQQAIDAATAAALISQQTVLVPMAIESAIRNENNTGMDSYAQVLALGMVVVVALVMGAHALLLRRAARWTKDAR